MMRDGDGHKADGDGDGDGDGRAIGAGMDKEIVMAIRMEIVIWWWGVLLCERQRWR